MPTATVTYDWKAALLAAAETAINDTTVMFCWGEPDHWADDVVMLGRSSSEQAPATMGTPRSREETLTCEVHVIASRTDPAECEARAYYLLGLLERQCRMVDPNVGGTVRECVLTMHEADGGLLENDPTGRRVTEIIATFTAKVRVTG